jgi:hypothetical protein
MSAPEWIVLVAVSVVAYPMVAAGTYRVFKALGLTAGPFVEDPDFGPLACLWPVFLLPIVLCAGLIRALTPICRRIAGE